MYRKVLFIKNTNFHWYPLAKIIIYWYFANLALFKEILKRILAIISMFFTLQRLCFAKYITLILKNFQKVLLVCFHSLVIHAKWWQIFLKNANLASLAKNFKKIICLLRLSTNLFVSWIFQLYQPKSLRKLPN